MTRSPNFTWDGRPVEYLQLPRTPVKKTGATIRPVTRARTLACTACELRESCRAPVPPMFPDRPSSAFAVIGEAPGQLEDRKGQVFVGKSGQVLRKLAREAGIDVDSGSWFNVNACRPPGNATPTIEQRAACRPNLLRALEAANTRYVLLCGATATNAWRTGVKVTRVRGRWFLWWQEAAAGEEEEDVRRGWWVLPTLHPAAVLRRPALRAELRADLATFAEVVNGSTTPTPSLTCVECDEPMTRWDADGVGWCESDWRKTHAANTRTSRRHKLSPDQETFKF